MFVDTPVVQVRRDWKCPLCPGLLVYTPKNTSEFVIPDRPRYRHVCNGCKLEQYADQCYPTLIIKEHEEKQGANQI